MRQRGSGSINQVIQCGYQEDRAVRVVNRCHVEQAKSVRGSRGHIYIWDPTKGFGGNSVWRGRRRGRGMGSREEVMQ